MKSEMKIGNYLDENTLWIHKDLKCIILTNFKNPEIWGVVVNSGNSTYKVGGFISVDNYEKNEFEEFHGQVILTN